MPRPRSDRKEFTKKIINVKNSANHKDRAELSKPSFTPFCVNQRICPSLQKVEDKHQRENKPVLGHIRIHIHTHTHLL